MMSRFLKHGRSIFNCRSIPILLVVYLYYSNTLCAEAAKILVPGPSVQGMGHVQILSTLTARLVQSGHNVTLLSGSKKCSDKFSASNASQTIFYRSPDATINLKFAPQIEDVKFHDYTWDDQTKIFFGLHDAQAEDCRALVGDVNLLERLKSEKFDILIGDMNTPCDIFIANILGIPWIPVTANREYMCICNYIYRIPAELSYVPQFALYMLTDKMSFLERLGNVLFYIYFNSCLRPFFMREFIKIKEEYNIAPEMDLWEMSSKAEIWLSQTSPVLDYPAPGLPNFVPVGGLGVRPPNALSQVSNFFMKPFHVEY